MCCLQLNICNPPVASVKWRKLASNGQQRQAYLLTSCTSPSAVHVVAVIQCDAQHNSISCDYAHTYFSITVTGNCKAFCAHNIRWVLGHSV